MEPNRAPVPRPVGVALWLLKGCRLVDRIEWVIRNDFKAVSLLQGVMETDQKERSDAAAAIKEAGLIVTYHGNVGLQSNAGNVLDLELAHRVIDDVVWWHENTSGVSSCCSDPISRETERGEKIFQEEASRDLMALLHGGLTPHGIRSGIENVFGGHGKLCSGEDLGRFAGTCGLPGMGLLLDAGHANIHVRSDGVEGEGTVGDFVRRLPLEVLEVHFSDNAGARDEHRSLGEGNLDLKECLGALDDVGYTGPLTIEVCRDILAGIYAGDIGAPEETDAILRSRDTIVSAGG